MLIRLINNNDQAFLREILYHAIYVEPGTPPPPREILTQPEIAHYVDDFGQHDGDMGLIAEDDSQTVGAAWIRLMEGYGFVDAETPELTIAVLPAYQGRGIGTQLIEGIFREIGSTRSAVSLSVTWSNPARRLYERLGFELLTLENGTATMRKRL